MARRRDGSAHVRLARCRGRARARRRSWRWRSASRNGCRRARPRQVRGCPESGGRRRTGDARRVRLGTRCSPMPATVRFCRRPGSNPCGNAAVVNRSLSSGPAGIPNGRFTGKTEERFARRRCRLIVHPRWIRQRLREGTEWALRVIVVIGAVDVVERLERLAHGSMMTYTTPQCGCFPIRDQPRYARQDAPWPSGLDSPCLDSHLALSPMLCYGYILCLRCVCIENTMEDSPSGLWRTLGKRVGVTASRVRISYPPPSGFEPCSKPFFIANDDGISVIARSPSSSSLSTQLCGKTDGKISCTTQTLERQTSESPACPHKDEEHIPFALNSGKSTPKYPSRHYRVASYRALRPPPIF